MREAVKEKVLAKFPEGSQTTEKLDSEGSLFSYNL